MILGGLADAVIAGGIDIASDTTLVGFGALEAVSSEITNPLSKNRHGITLGDGAAFFVITKEALDSKVQLLGWGESSDAYHMTSPDPSGAGAQKAISRALKSSGLAPEDVGYINLHGTGTKLNDSMESKAVAAVFGDYPVPLSSTKAVTGHTLGAAAALEAAICWKLLVENQGKNLDNGKLPLQVWDGVKDEELPALNIVDKNFKNKADAADKEIKACLSNSFAFGGANACLALGI